MIIRIKLLDFLFSKLFLASPIAFRELQGENMEGKEGEGEKE
jgi:hypothetical protein